MSYCKQYNVELCATKTKLVMISPNHQPVQIPINPISIYGHEIAPSDQAEHVGVIRSEQGNLPHLLGRILNHKKAKFAILSSGLSRGHRGNPAAAVVLEKIYALPVLLSGVSSLYLTSCEMNMIDNIYKTTLCNLLKLYNGTPQAFVYFMAGSLPGRALIHQRQLSLFFMICNLRGDPLHRRARHALTSLLPKHKSWFNQIRDICLLYGLPHPLTLLSDLPHSRSCASHSFLTIGKQSFEQRFHPWAPWTTSNQNSTP